jgi:Dockerin type I domain
MAGLALQVGVEVAMADNTVYRWPARCLLETFTPIPDTDPPLHYSADRSSMGPDGTGFVSFAAQEDALPNELVYHGLGCNAGAGFVMLGNTLDDAVGMPDGWVFYRGVADLWRTRFGFDDGSVLFTATTTDDPDDFDVWKGGGLFVASPDGNLHALAVTGQPVVGGEPGETFKGNYDFEVASPAGHVATYANTRYADGTSDDHNEALFRGTKDGLEVYWRTGHDAPGFPDGSLIEDPVLNWISMNTWGDLVVNCIVASPWGDVSALYVEHGSGAVLLARRGMWVPDMPGWFFDTSFDYSWINDSGLIAISGLARNPGGPPWWSKGVWIAEPGEDLRTLFLLPVPVPIFGAAASFDSRGVVHLDNKGCLITGGSLLYEEHQTGDGATASTQAGGTSHSSTDGAQYVDGPAYGRPSAAEYTYWRVNLETEHLLPLAHPGQRYPGLPHGVKTLGVYADAALTNNNGLAIIQVELEGPGVTKHNDEALVVTNLYGESRVLLREGSQIDLSGDGSDIRTFDRFRHDIPSTSDEVVIFNDRNELVLDLEFSEPWSLGAWVFDLSEMVACGPDLNNDGYVDQHDLGLLLAAYGTTPGEAHWSQRADINLDGVVDQADLQEVLVQYEQACE